MSQGLKEVHFLGEKRLLLGIKPKIGKKVPDFNCISYNLQPFESKSLNNTLRVISVVPSIDTSVCAVQTKQFEQFFNEHPDVNVITISNDTPFALDRFRKTSNINNIITVSDYLYLSFGMKYGVLMEGLRLLARSIFIVDEENILRYVHINEDAGTDIDFEEVFSTIETLRTTK